MVPLSRKQPRPAFQGEWQTTVKSRFIPWNSKTILLGLDLIPSLDRRLYDCPAFPISKAEQPDHGQQKELKNREKHKDMDVPQVYEIANYFTGVSLETQSSDEGERM